MVSERILKETAGDDAAEQSQGVKEVAFSRSVGTDDDRKGLQWQVNFP
jgi:hypothetical protein